MSEDRLFQDSVRMQKITPYSKLRKLRGLSQDEVAEEIHITKRSLIDIERGARDAPKNVILDMEKLYGCKGKLIAYWLNVRFSVSNQPGLKNMVNYLKRIWE